MNLKTNLFIATILGSAGLAVLTTGVYYANQHSTSNQTTIEQTAAVPSSTIQNNANDQPGPATCDTIRRIWNDSKKRTTLHAIDPNEIDQFEALFLKTLESDTSEQELAQAWSTLGWTLTKWKYAGETFLAVHEKTSQRSGRGLFMIRIDSNSDLILQAPHRFYDRDTGLIARQLFEEHDVRAIAVNTVHRKQIDLAHTEQHHLNAFTRAIIANNSEARILQIHGFANESKTGVATTAQIIVSDTNYSPGRLARYVAIELKRVFGKSAVRLFPIEVQQLGGTKNAQANTAKEAGSVGFLHLELNANSRKKLVNSASLRALFFDSLASPRRISRD